MKRLTELEWDEIERRLTPPIVRKLKGLQRQMDHDVRCLDCCRPYPHGLDMILTLKQWKMIHPDRGGVLCPSCIVNRASHLDGSIAVYSHIVLGSHEREGSALEKIVEALRLENADYCSRNGDLEHELELLRAKVRST